MDPERGANGCRFAADREEDAGAEWDAGPVFCDRRRGADADDAEFLGC